MKNRILNRKIWVSGVPHKVGTGWLSPQPDLRDYTPLPAIRSPPSTRNLNFPALTAQTAEPQDRKTRKPMLTYANGAVLLKIS